MSDLKNMVSIRVNEFIHNSDGKNQERNFGKKLNDRKYYVIVVPAINIYFVFICKYIKFSYLLCFSRTIFEVCGLKLLFTFRGFLNFSSITSLFACAAISLFLIGYIILKKSRICSKYLSPLSAGR